MGRIDDNNKFRQNWEEMIAAQSVVDFSNKLRLIEKFFRSGWFETISEIDGNEFIEKLKEKVESGYTKRASSVRKKGKGQA